MQTIIARLLGGRIMVESLVVMTDGRAQHQYRVHGGPDDGRVFTRLVEVHEYLTRVTATV